MADSIEIPVRIVLNHGPELLPEIVFKTVIKHRLDHRSELRKILTHLGTNGFLDFESGVYYPPHRIQKVFFPKSEFFEKD